MPRIDRYDIIGMALLAFLAALWILHFSLPTPPPDNYRTLGRAMPTEDPESLLRS